jgi:hypothetical protein
MGLSFVRSSKPKIVNEEPDRWLHRIRGYHLWQWPRYRCWPLPVVGHRQRYRRSVISEARSQNQTQTQTQTQHSELVHGIRSVVGIECVSHFHKILADQAEYDTGICVGGGSSPLGTVDRATCNAVS